MNMKKLLIIAILSVSSVMAFSQGSYTSLQYSVGIGTGNMHDFISPMSWRGFNIDYRSLVQQNLGVGVDFSWNVFYDELPYSTYNNGNMDYSGKQWHYSNNFPMLLAFDYYVDPDADLSTYVGLGIGTMYTIQNNDMSMYTFETDAWQFCLRPEVGINVYASESTSLCLTGKYFYGFKSGDLDAQGYFAIGVGLTLKD
jgi:hypothetical protein